MFLDTRSLPEGEVVEADVCVIGAGAAGITIARELAGTSLRVALLESGGLEFDGETQALFRGENTGLPYFPLDAARLRFFGGTTNHWGGVCRPFEEEDFEPKEWIPYTGWPIRLRDVDPYYPRAAEICGLRSSEWDTEAWQRRDRFPPLPLDARRVYTRLAQTVEKGKRSFGRRFRDEIEAASSVHAYLYANVTEIETNETASRVTRVRVATLTGRQLSVKATVFVLAVGGIENPRLLLASRGARPAGLGNDHDLVGRFFLEHPRFPAAAIVPADRHLDVGFYDQHDVAGSTLRGYLALPPELLRSERLTEVQTRIGAVYDEAFEAAFASRDADAVEALAGLDDFGRSLRTVLDDVMTWQEFVMPASPLPVPYPEVVAEVARSSSRELEGLVPKLLGDLAAFAYREITGVAPIESLVVTTRIEPAPNPDSRVTLSPDLDALGMPRVELDWQLSPIDKRSALRSVEILASELGRTGLGRVRLLVDDVEGSWPDTLAGGWHLMGTTRMSDDPRTGVVDRDCRVHGIDNLFIAGSSVFPTAGSGTPTMLIVALALRLSDHLRRLLR